MKILNKILLCLMVFFLFGCTGKKEETKQEMDLGGKTFYDTSDLHKVPSKVWFGKDGSFVLTDDFTEGYDEMNGSYKVDQGVITLSVENGGGNKYSKIIFETKDEETIILRTNLLGSKNTAVYSIHEPKVEIKEEETAVVDETPMNVFKVYYNATQKLGKDASCLELHNDGSFNFYENNGKEKLTINGLYGKEGDYYMFSNFPEFEGSKGSKIYNFEFKIVNEDTLILQEDLLDSRAYDTFTTDGTINVTAASEEDPFKDSFKTTTWTHAKIPDVADIYHPSITIASDYSFKFTENCYSGMAEISGYCQKTDSGWACDILDNSKMKGFKGDDVKTLIFEQDEKGNLILKTDLCMSLSGDAFIK